MGTFKATQGKEVAGGRLISISLAFGKAVATRRPILTKSIAR